MYLDLLKDFEILCRISINEVLRLEIKYVKMCFILVILLLNL